MEDMRTEDMKQLIKDLVKEINGANSKEQLNGYFDYMVSDMDINSRLARLGFEDRIVNPIAWSVSISRHRGEIYVYNADGQQVFTIPEENWIHGMEHMDTFQLRECIKEHWSDMIIDLGLEGE